MHKALATAAITLALTTSAITHAEEKSTRDKAVDYRQSAMTLIGANFKPMGAMVKGELAYDPAVFARHAKDLGAVASIDILRGFPEDSEGDNSDAKAEIWLEWEDFKSKMSDMQRETAALAKVAATDDKAAIKKQFGKTAETCKACHKKFKE